jgi:hypothetical protein
MADIRNYTRETKQERRLKAYSVDWISIRTLNLKATTLRFRPTIFWNLKIFKGLKIEKAPQVGLEPTTLRLTEGFHVCCWELRTVADSLIVLHLPILARC